MNAEMQLSKRLRIGWIYEPDMAAAVKEHGGLPAVFGLPEDAVLVEVGHVAGQFGCGFKFYHDSFEPVLECEVIPRVNCRITGDNAVKFLAALNATLI